MKTSSRSGFTLVEAMVSMTIAGIAMSGALGLYLTGLRAMYRDNQRLATNSALRYFIAHVSKETLDSTEFYIFPNYQSFDGTIDLSTKVSATQNDTYGTALAHGDCLLLATRVSADVTTSNIRQFRIYYRVGTDTTVPAPIRYYESTDYGASGTSTTLTALVNAINLKANPSLSGSRQVVASARGRLKPDPTTCYPIFSSESATSVNACVAVNVEVITGTSVNNMLSSSSFNYTISPRK